MLARNNVALTVRHHLEFQPAVHDGAASDPRAERDRCAGAFRIALQRKHESVAVDDTGGRRQQRGMRMKCRLNARNIRLIEPLKVAYTGLRGITVDSLERCHLARVGGDNELADLAMLDMTRHTIIV